jgi:hypothetical protein
MSIYQKFVVLLMAVCLPFATLATTADRLQTAAKDGKVAFLLVIEPGVAGVDPARQMIQSATIEVPGAVMIELDRADVADSMLVQKYGLAAAPVPLILVIGANGAMAGGNVASQLTSQKLVAMIPSPKKAEVLKAVQSGQAVYLTASRSGMPSSTVVASGCAAACSQMMGKCVAVDVNIDDPLEAEFLTLLKVNLQSTEPVTVVINAQGQITGSFNGPVDVAQLVQAATKKAGGCCPTGSGKSCAPAPKKKGS